MSRGSKQARYEIDMCNGPILKKVIMFAVPLMFSSILQLLFNAADIVVVGRFAGDNSLAAVGSTSSLINLLTNLFVGLSVGVNVLISRYYGAGQEDELKETIHTAITVSMISGILLTVVGCVGAKQILQWMQTPKEVLPLAGLYMRVYFLGMTAVMVYNFGSAILRAVGDTKRPLYYLSLAGIVNVGLNLFFVILLKMDVAGVGLATAISQCISAVLVIRCLVMEDSAIHLDLRALKVHKGKLIRILQIGLPAGFQGTLFSFSNVIVQSTINSFGPVVVAGSSAAANIEGFVYVAMNSLYQAAISFTGQNVGAGKYERINRILFCSIGCVIVVGLVLGNGVYLVGEKLLGIYTGSPEVIAEGMVRMKYLCVPYFICGVMDVMVGMLRGLGYAMMPMFVSLVGACGLRLLLIATVFQMEGFHKITTVYMAYPVTWFITGAAHIVCFVIVRKKLAGQWGK